MGDFFTGMTYGDQLEMGMAIVGGSVDNETLNAMIRQEMDERTLAAQHRLEFVVASHCRRRPEAQGQHRLGLHAGARGGGDGVALWW